MTTHIEPVTLSTLRNLGISAHIDAGKTTLSERILFHAGKIRRIGEVRSELGATMDALDLERERGITIQSASTQVRWRGHAINLIDTPGHVDFTVEVERALAVLDGAVLVLCGVAGVQPQTLTVDRQMRRHQLPRLCFINKLDRAGADALAVAEALRARVDAGAVLINLPIYAEEGPRRRLVGVADVIRGVALSFAGEGGSIVREGPPPAALVEPLRRARARLIEALADHDEALLAAVVDDLPVADAQLIAALRAATIARAVTPVLCGSAHDNIGVQPLLDAVVAYLPAPDARPRVVYARDGGAAVSLRAGADGPTCAVAFKIDDGPFGQTTSLRILQGRLARGDRLVNGRSGERVRVGRLVRMQALQMEEIEAADAGDIVAVFGVECAQSDLLCGGPRLVARPLVVPEAVMAYAIRCRDPSAQARLARALGRFTREDPSLRASRDPESGETILAGVGELHLAVVLERMRREHDLDLEVGPPEIAYRETVTVAAEFDHLHRKQDGGAGQYARVCGAIAPIAAGDDAPAFVDQVAGGAIPRDMIAACEQGLADALARGPLIGAPVVGVRMILRDGQTHAKDSSPLAFRIAAAAAVRAALRQAAPAILEPCMQVHVDAPAAASGPVIAGLLRRRGRVIAQAVAGDALGLDAVVPLAEMFGYVGDLRGVTQGQGSFTMEVAGYEPVPEAIQRELVARLGGRAARSRG